MRIGQFINDSVDKLAVCGSKTPRLDVDLLVSGALNCSREHLYVKQKEDLSASDLSKCEKMIFRRIYGEPVAYILGQRGFYKHSFVVNSEVLIPRPETEGIVEIILDEYKKQQSEQDTPISLLDIGTGSGCIGLSLLKEISNSQLMAVDISPKALEVAKLNAEKLQVIERTFFKCQSGDDLRQEDLDRGFEEGFDFIVSNPPYISMNSEDIEQDVKSFEPHLALFADDNGLRYLKSWIIKAQNLLKPGGVAVFEMGYDQAESLRQFFKTLVSPMDFNIKKDLSGKDRYLVFSKQK